jgi:hypothetical protein
MLAKHWHKIKICVGFNDFFTSFRHFVKSILKKKYLTQILCFREIAQK